MDGHDVNRATEWTARSGYAARGLVYLLVGAMTVLALLGRGGGTPDAQGALEMLLAQPAGTALLALIGVGLLGYAAWRATQAIADTDHHGTDAKGLAVRGGLLASAVIHLLLAGFAWSLITGDGGGSGGSSSQDWTARLMSQPFGVGLVGLVGVAIAGAGVAHGVKGWKVRFDRYLVMDPTTRRWAYPVCRFGLITRGLLLVIVGWFFVQAAWQADPSEAGGLAEALGTLRGQPHGTVLLGLVALGLLAFGAYSIIEAFYRRIDAPRELASARSPRIA